MTGIDRQSILKSLQEVVSDATCIDPDIVTLEMYWIDDLDIDSLSLMEIVAQAEERYGIKISDDDYYDELLHGRVQDTVEFVYKRLNANL